MSIISKKYLWRCVIILGGIACLYFGLRIVVPYYFVIRINSITSEEEEKEVYFAMHKAGQSFLWFVGIMPHYVVTIYHDENGEGKEGENEYREGDYRPAKALSVYFVCMFYPSSKIVKVWNDSNVEMLIGP